MGSTRRPTPLLEAQTHAWIDPNQRAAVARRLLEHRFNGAVDTAGKSITQLLEFDDARMRQLYHVLGKEHGLRPVNGSYDPRARAPHAPLNQALSTANACLHEVVRTAITALGCSPSLGFLHQDQEDAFMHDISDLYQAGITVPIAYKASKKDNPQEAARRSFQQEERSSKLETIIIHDIQSIINPQAKLHNKLQYMSLAQQG